LISQRREIRGIPQWLLCEYLLELGGEIQEDGTIAGEGWRARLQQIEDYQLGSLRVGQVEMLLEVEPAQQTIIIPALEKKLLRAGG
jgi:hypothetical protein